MTGKALGSDYFEKFLDERFNRLHERLDTIERKSDRRDYDVNMLDTTNKAEMKAVKDQVILVQQQIGNVKFLLRSVFVGVSALGAFFSWLVDAWGHVASAFRGVGS